MTILRTLWFICSLLVTYHTGAQSFGFVLPEGKEQIVLPFELRNQLIILKVSVNGSVPLNFILDSGSRNTFLLKPELKDSLKLQPGGQMFVLGAGLRDTVLADIIRQVTLQSGALTGSFQSILVLNREIPEISEMLGMEIHGILGADLFNRFAIHVNYRKRRLKLTDPNLIKSPAGYTEIPVEIRQNKGYIHTILYNEWLQPQLAKLMVDCGASLAFLFNYPGDGENEEETYPYFSTYIESEIGIGLSGAIPGYIGRLHSAHLSTFIFNDIIVSAVPYTKNAAFFLDERDGLIGGEMLSRFHIWYNFPLEKLYVRPSRSYSKPFRYDMSGILWTGRRNDEHQPVVKQIVAGSAAEKAGIQAGDEIITINGKASEGMSNAELYELMKSKEGRTLQLLLNREDKPIRVRLKLKSYL